MIGAGYRAAKLARLVDRNHATVAAYILEHVDVAFSVTNHQQRSAEEIKGLTMPGRGMSLPKPTAAQRSWNRVLRSWVNMASST